MRVTADMLVLGRTAHDPDPYRGAGRSSGRACVSAPCPVVVIGQAAPDPADRVPESWQRALDARPRPGNAGVIDTRRVPSPLVEVSPRVSAALAAGEPVVALESTIISHGLPRPDNHAAAKKFEELLEHQGVTPATIAVIDGMPKVGPVAARPGAHRGRRSVVKVGSRDIASRSPAR